MCGSTQRDGLPLFLPHGLGSVAGSEPEAFDLMIDLVSMGSTGRVNDFIKKIDAGE